MKLINLFQFISLFSCFAGEFGVYFPGYIHAGVLLEDSGLWVCVSRGRLFTELLEHTGLRHRFHGVRRDLRFHLTTPRSTWGMSVEIFMSIIRIKSTAYTTHVCFGNCFLQSLHLRLGYHQQDSRCASREGRGL